jgi:hypothetical protein
MPSHGSGTARASRRTGALAAALLGAMAVWGSPAQAASPTIAVEGDSVLVTGQSFGPTTVRATRPDALTSQPVVIGQYAGSASAMGPFSVNTTVPTPLTPDGDCWQKGALPSAVTPDLQPGDTVTVAQEATFSSEASTTSVAVTPAMVDGAVGPTPACRDIAPHARNAVTSRPDSVAGGAIALSGVAQPFAAGVSVSATDGTLSTAPVTVSPANDGSWSATIPAGQVDRLAGGPITVTPVFEVPDVSTGATAHIAGPATQVSKVGANAKPGASGPRHGGSPNAMRVRSLRRPARIGLGSARRNGIRASFVVPTGARVVRVQLKRGGKVQMRRVVPAGTAGSRQTVRLRGPRLRRVLHPGTFRIAVSAGPSRAQLGPPVSRAIVIR